MKDTKKYKTGDKVYYRSPLGEVFPATVKSVKIKKYEEEKLFNTERWERREYVVEYKMTHRPFNEYMDNNGYYRGVYGDPETKVVYSVTGQYNLFDRE